jgi:hypothetical protein
LSKVGRCCHCLTERRPQGSSQERGTPSEYSHAALVVERPVRKSSCRAMSLPDTDADGQCNSVLSATSLFGTRRDQDWIVTLSVISCSRPLVSSIREGTVQAITSTNPSGAWIEV